MEIIAQPSDAPLGLCRKCRMVKMNRIVEGCKEVFCPRCDTKSETASGLVNDVTITKDDFKVVINALGFAEQVPSDDPRPAATVQQINAAPKSDRKGRAEPAKVPTETPATGGVTTSVVIDRTIRLPVNLAQLFVGQEDVTGTLDLIPSPEQLERLYEFLLQLETPKDLRAARELIKIVDRVESLLGDK